MRPGLAPTGDVVKTVTANAGTPTPPALKVFYVIDRDPVTDLGWRLLGPQKDS